MTTLRMGRLEFTTPRAAWGGEASDFTPLLSNEDMLSYLGEETGIGPLILIETEHVTAGGRSLDILAETGDARRVAIENQYGAANHDHLTRGLAYAVGVGARALVIVAEDHRDEFVAVANYLNEVAQRSEEDGILVWLVQVRAVRRVEDVIWSPEFVVMAEPNAWEAETRRATAQSLKSLDDFYERCEDEGWAEQARTVVEDWLEQGLPELHTSTKAVSLYCPLPGETGRGPNVVQLWTRGDFTVCRQRILDTDVLDVAGIARLDGAIRTSFPQARWPEKQHFITSSSPTADKMMEFTRWLVAELRPNTSASVDG